jgi:F0F1-type ATP synthase membrane subunit b/b'
LSPALANFLFEAANFLLLAAVLGWVLFRPVRRILDAERERHAKTEQETERLRTEATTLATEARSARDAARRQAEDDRRTSQAAARAEAAKLLDDARREGLAERHALAEELRAARAADAAALAETIGRLAAASVRRLLDALPGPALDAALVRAACAELETLSNGARSPAVVESARTLDPEARRLLEGVLGAGFEEHVVGELGAGVRVTTPAGQVDATAVALARRAAEAVGSLEADPHGGSE